MYSGKVKEIKHSSLTQVSRGGGDSEDGEQSEY